MANGSLLPYAGNCSRYILCESNSNNDHKVKKLIINYDTHNVNISQMVLEKCKIVV